MPRKRKHRRVGRPKGSKPVVSRDAVLDAALELLERAGLPALTMRALARSLHIDPMAPYHYFPDKRAILHAAAERAYSRLEFRAGANATWNDRLVLLGTKYLEFLGHSGELLRYLAASGSTATDAATRSFDSHFRAAVSGLPLTKDSYRLAHDTFVDFIHGFSLAVRGRPSASLLRRFRAELDVVLSGIERLRS
jgi:AcrR family transcriptional regulator